MRRTKCGMFLVGRKRKKWSVYVRLLIGPRMWVRKIGPRKCERHDISSGVDILFGVGGEPVDVVGGLGVDGGGDVGVAVVSPGDDAAELPVLLADERSARVAVTGGVAIEAGAELILR